MDGGLNKPQQLTFIGDKASEWTRFEMLYDTYILSLYHEKPEASKAAMLLNLAGEEAQLREKAFVYKPAVMNEAGDAVVTPAESRAVVAVLKKKFKEICNVTKNIIMERHAFNVRNQKLVKDEKTKKESPEDMTKWITDLRILAATCNYGELKDDFIRDRIVVGLLPQLDHIRLQLLKKADLTLDKAIEICNLNEQAVIHTNMIKQKEAADVDAVQKHGGKSQHHGKKCQRCTKTHGYGRCPAYGSQCNICGGMNH